jgi:phosphotransferase system enzyme I (PtsI)
MEIKKGIAVSPGLIIGPAVVLEAEEYCLVHRPVPDEQVPEQLQRLASALEAADEEYRQVQERARQELGDEFVTIFRFQADLLKDPHLRAELTEEIEKNHYSAEYAVSRVIRRYTRRFLHATSGYLAERVRDVYDAEKRLLRILIGQTTEALAHLQHPAIVIAHDLSPTQTAGFDRQRILGFATDVGGRTSHTAILARALGLPAVVGLSNITAEISGGDTVIIDGYRGVVIISPDPPTVEKYQKQQAEYQRIKVELAEEAARLPAVTKDNERVILWGNIEFPHEVHTCLEGGAEGIGLYRTEFLYLGAKGEPTEAEHFEAYRESIQALGGAPIILRTVDLGADKISAEEEIIREERNPVLGLRSIRYCLQNIAMFKTQIRAMLRASVLGDVRIMFPMITNLHEFRQARMVVADVMEDLEEEGIEFDRDIRVGMMVEVPSAALQAKAFAKAADFLSIGTNDLIQYTLAVDRNNGAVATMFSAADPSVLRLIRGVISAAGRYQTELSMCGEMCSEPTYAMLLLGMGLRRFSLSAPSIAAVKRVIRSVSIEQCERIAERVKRMESQREIMTYLRDAVRHVLPGEPY